MEEELRRRRGDDDAKAHDEGKEAEADEEDEGQRRHARYAKHDHSGGHSKRECRMRHGNKQKQLRDTLTPNGGLRCAPNLILFVCLCVWRGAMMARRVGQVLTTSE